MDGTVEGATYRYRGFRSLFGGWFGIVMAISLVRLLTGEIEGWQGKLGIVLALVVIAMAILESRNARIVVRGTTIEEYGWRGERRIVKDLRTLTACETPEWGSSWGRRSFTLRFADGQEILVLSSLTNFDDLLDRVRGSLPSTVEDTAPPIPAL